MDTTNTSQTGTADQRTTLVFGIGQEEYAIDIALVQELRRYGGVTRLANAPAYLKGVTNLRGVIVPLLDLRIKFGQSQPSYNDSTVVVILNLSNKTIGIVVDRVADVVPLAPEQLRPAPQLHQVEGSNHVLAVATVDERMLILVDMAKLLSDSECGVVGALPLAA